MILLKAVAKTIDQNVRFCRSHWIIRMRSNSNYIPELKVSIIAVLNMKIKRYGITVREIAIKPPEKYREYRCLDVSTRASTRVEYNSLWKALNRPQNRVVSSFSTLENRLKMFPAFNVDSNQHYKYKIWMTRKEKIYS